MSLCETLDRVLNKGAVISGDILISVADVDLLYIGLNLMVTSIETMKRQRGEAAPAAISLASGTAAGVTAKAGEIPS